MMRLPSLLLSLHANWMLIVGAECLDVVQMELRRVCGMNQMELRRVCAIPGAAVSGQMELRRVCVPVLTFLVLGIRARMVLNVDGLPPMKQPAHSGVAGHSQALRTLVVSLFSEAQTIEQGLAPRVGLVVWMEKEVPTEMQPAAGRVSCRQVVTATRGVEPAAKGKWQGK